VKKKRNYFASRRIPLSSAVSTVTECSAKRRDQRQTANRSSPLVGESVQRRKKEEIAYHIDEDE
jgi:hypothetical protein